MSTLCFLFEDRYTKFEFTRIDLSRWPSYELIHAHVMPSDDMAIHHPIFKAPPRKI